MLTAVVKKILSKEANHGSSSHVALSFNFKTLIATTVETVFGHEDCGKRRICTQREEKKMKRRRDDDKNDDELR